MYPSKNLGAFGDAGIVVTNIKSLSLNINSIKNYGTKSGKKYEYERIGINSRLDPIQAAILDINLKYLEKWNFQRQEIAHYYLQNIERLSSQQHLQFDGSVYHHFPIHVKNRNKVQEFIKSHGIQTLVHYPKSAASIYYKIKGIEKMNFPIADKIAKETLSIPLHQWLSKAEITKIVKILNKKEVQANLA
jgi:dTDP-4-amino-4,6-dideoxygalactose transaminase